MSYLVETGEHQLWKRHVDQLKTLADAKPVDGRDVVSPDSTDTHEDFKVSIPSPADISPAIYPLAMEIRKSRLCLRPTLSVRLLIVTRDDIELLRSISVSVMERTELSGEECGKLRLMYFVLCMQCY